MRSREEINFAFGRDGECYRTELFSSVTIQKNEQDSLTDILLNIIKKYYMESSYNNQYVIIGHDDNRDVTNIITQGYIFHVFDYDLLSLVDELFHQEIYPNPRTVLKVLFKHSYSTSKVKEAII